MTTLQMAKTNDPPINEFIANCIQTDIAWTRFWLQLMMPFIKLTDYTNDPELAILDDCAEALIITVKDDQINIGHKLKSDGGILNSYLTSILTQLLKVAASEATNSSTMMTHQGRKYHNGQTQASIRISPETIS